MVKITKEFLESQIADISYRRLSGTLICCSIVVKNGFVFTGISACLDESKFDAGIGNEIAYNKAFEKMWEYYGFWLKQKQYEEEHDAAV